MRPRATIYQIPTAPVVFDPPVTAESVAQAKAASDAERMEVARYQALRDEHKLLLSHMRDVHGSRQVRAWLDGLDAIDAWRGI